MSSARGSWIASRHPRPPRSLAEWLISDDAGSEPARLVERGLSELERARAALGPVRQSAFHLLASDAWVTYACEAALESEDPDGELLRIIEEIVAA